MYHQNFRLWITLWTLSTTSALSDPIRNLVFTETIKDVKVLNPATRSEFPAKVGTILVPPNILKTGPESRAELISEDKTVTRIGSNTIFSIDPNTRNVNLPQGSVLFHSPSGKGGGNIRSSGASASVLGTTLIVGANPSGGFKTMLLEGTGRVTAPDGQSVTVTAGQMSFAMPNQRPSIPLNFSLAKQVGSSKLLTGFSTPVASKSKIDAAVAKQQAKIARGELDNTGLAIGDRPDSAYTIDTTTIKIVQQQVQKEQSLASRKQLDPRYITAVAASLSLDSIAPPSENLFVIDGSGANPENSFGLPSTLPGNRDGHGAHSVLIANNLAFGATGSNIFFSSPNDAPKDLNHVALVALTNVSIARSLQFLGLTGPTGAPLDPFLISAGNSIELAPGIALQADVPLWEIHAGGSSLTADINLAQNPFTSPDTTLVLNWTGIALTDSFSDPSDPSLSPTIRISAPSISLTDSRLQAETIDITAQKDLAIKRSAAPVTLPLGFTSPEDLTLNGVSVKLTSGRALSLINVPIVANSVQLTAGTDMTLSSISTLREYTAGDRSLTAKAGAKLTIIDSNLQSLDNATNPLLFVDLKAGTDVVLGSEPAPDTNVSRRIVTTTEFKTVVIGREVKINAVGDIIKQGVTVGADKLTATAANTINLNNVDLSQAHSVALTAQTIVLADTQFNGTALVNLNSRTGLVAADPGNGGSVRNGMVNFVRNVFYGETEIKFSTSGADVSHAGFQSAATAAGKNLSGITIGKK